MTAWDPSRYLQFADERTRPAYDLAARIPLTNPKRVVDLGCGPGNSTAVLKKRWPDAAVIGVDNAPEMLTAAAKTYPAGTWVRGDVATWTAAEPVDVVFANASLHWVPDHATVIPHLFRLVAAGGCLAFQLTAHFDSPVHALINAVAARPGWRGNPAAGRIAFTAERPGFYYDLLAPLASSMDIWLTEYEHVMPDAQAVLDWVRTTSLRPVLIACADDAERAEFERQLLAEIGKAFPVRADGRVLFPFRRVFVVARRPD